MQMQPHKRGKLLHVTYFWYSKIPYHAFPEEHTHYCAIQSEKDYFVCLTCGPQRVYSSDREEAVYLTKVDENGAHRTVHSINPVARVRCPHFPHPLERQQAAMINKLVTYSHNSHKF